MKRPPRPPPRPPRLSGRPPPPLSTQTLLHLSPLPARPGRAHSLNFLSAFHPALRRPQPARHLPAAPGSLAAVPSGQVVGVSGLRDLTTTIFKAPPHRGGRGRVRHFRPERRAREAHTHPLPPLLCSARNWARAEPDARGSGERRRPEGAGARPSSS